MELLPTLELPEEISTHGLEEIGAVALGAMDVSEHDAILSNNDTHKEV